MVVVWKFDDIFGVLAYQLGGQHQKICAYGVERGQMPLSGQTQTFEPMNQIEELGVASLHSTFDQSTAPIRQSYSSNHHSFQHPPIS